MTLVVCFMVLLLATCNLIMSFYAMFYVGAILGNILTVVNYLLEWEVGFTVSIAIVVIIGFAGMIC